MPPQVSQSRIEGVGKPLSRLILGTMVLNAAEIEMSFALLDAAFGAGINTFDTAHVYRNGDCERILGRWAAERGIRDRVVFITKGAHPNPDRKRVTPHDIASDIADSLARMKADCIDLYLLHRDDPAMSAGTIIETLNAHKAEGRIAAFGASNWTHPRIELAKAYATIRGLIPFAASSPHFSLAEQFESPWGDDCVAISGPREADARAWYEKSRMPVLAWSSLARGFFSGRLTRANAESLRETFDKTCVKAYWREENFQRLDRAWELAKKKAATVPQIALAWVLRQPMNVFPLIGPANPEELKECLGALELEMSDDEAAWLDLRS